MSADPEQLIGFEIDDEFTADGVKYAFNGAFATAGTAVDVLRIRLDDAAMPYSLDSVIPDVDVITNIEVSCF